jgi:hypothetical protein
MFLIPKHDPSSTFSLTLTVANTLPLMFALTLCCHLKDLASLTKFTKTFPAEMWSTKRDVQLWDDSLKLNYTIDSKKGYKMVLEDQIFGGIGQ